MKQIGKHGSPCVSTSAWSEKICPPYEILKTQLHHFRPKASDSAQRRRVYKMTTAWLWGFLLVVNLSNSNMTLTRGAQASRMVFKFKRANDWVRTCCPQFFVDTRAQWFDFSPPRDALDTHRPETGKHFIREFGLWHRPGGQRIEQKGK